ncbi:TPA: hypothetical protein DEF17_04135 [bacterium]|nr:MAG: hypothetical protein AUJ18_03915 [Candidatus Hydrogenedentes bacterium CG1_02_42_14]PIU46792.1 MAG: hypothetical protein COS94_09220 [Candidatus Hydrogenedentes bacterium CG07_land_8_20_14_0_80_42_17]HBW47106.1 hypothetical protein [bacterium]
MKDSIVDRLEKKVDELIQALYTERKLSKEYKIRIAELEAKLEKEPSNIEKLREENRRLRRNMEVAAQKIEELFKKI